MGQFKDWLMTEWRLFQVNGNPPYEPSDRDLGFDGYRVFLDSANGNQPNNCEIIIKDAGGNRVGRRSLRAMVDVDSPEWSSPLLLGYRNVYFAAKDTSSYQGGRALVRWIYPVGEVTSKKVSKGRKSPTTAALKKQTTSKGRKSPTTAVLKK